MQEPKIRFITPLSEKESVALYNAEHPEQYTEIYEVPPSFVKEFFDRNPDALIKTEPFSQTYEFPDNWDKMGKIERLKWLTENRK